MALVRIAAVIAALILGIAASVIGCAALYMSYLANERPIAAMFAMLVFVVGCFASAAGAWRNRLWSHALLALLSTPLAVVAVLGAVNPTPAYLAISYSLVSIAAVALFAFLFTILVRKQTSKAE